MKNYILSISLAILAGTFSACNKEETAGEATLHVRLTDAPADYDAVNVDIQRVEVNASDTEENGWVALTNVRPGIYNLLKLTSGIDTLLASGILPTGKLSQIRLVLGQNNSVVMNGETHKLSTPSAQQSGLKLNIHQTLENGIQYTVLLDFDAARSVIKAGNSGKYNLKPVIRTILSAQNGAIRGEITPSQMTSTVYAISGTDTVSTYANEGVFLLKGLASGKYKVIIQSGDSYQEKTVENVSVQIGKVTQLGAIGLDEKYYP